MKRKQNPVFIVIFATDYTAISAKDETIRIPFYSKCRPAFLHGQRRGGKPSVRQLPHLGNTPYQADTILAASEYRSTLVDTDNLEISTI